jgi:hypothetical protein
MISTGSQPCIRRTILRLLKALYSCLASYEEDLEGIGIQVYGHIIRSRFWDSVPLPPITSIALNSDPR